MSAPAPRADDWLTERWAGEVRVNLVRLAALLAFYPVHSLRYLTLTDPPPDEVAFHHAATAVALTWGGLVTVLYAALRDRRLPPALPYAAVLTDAALVTALVAAAGPRTPLVVLYWLVVASAPLRLSLPLVWAATLAGLAGYLAALGYHVFVRVGAETYYADPALRVPRAHEAIILLGLAAAGVLAGQVVRQVRRLTAGPPEGEGTP